uniref:Uncharacterized protein n=1 Tax=Anguilla anguilla TaxID=7936 RepID=A0A0E9WNU0_ANGAN
MLSSLLHMVDQCTHHSFLVPILNLILIRNISKCFVQNQNPFLNDKMAELQLCKSERVNHQLDFLVSLGTK